VCFSSFFLFSSLSCLSFSCFPEVSDFLSFLSSQLSLSHLCFFIFFHFCAREREKRREKERTEGINIALTHTYAHSIFHSRVLVYTYSLKRSSWEIQVWFWRKKKREISFQREERKKGD